jgi:hypothetical protein
MSGGSYGFQGQATYVAKPDLNLFVASNNGPSIILGDTQCLNT